MALAPAGVAAPAGDRLGRADRVHRRDLPADPAGATPAPSDRSGWLRRRLHRPLPVDAALSGRADPRDAMGAGGGRGVCRAGDPAGAGGIGVFVAGDGMRLITSG